MLTDTQFHCIQRLLSKARRVDELAQLVCELLLEQVKLMRQVFENNDGSPTLVLHQLNCYDRQTLIKDTL